MLNNSVYTPLHIIDEMLDLLDPALFSDRSIRWIEPGAGNGRIVNKLISRGVSPEQITAYEINPVCFPDLLATGCVLVQDSFLNHGTDCINAIVVANPPYAEANSGDTEHGISLFVKFMAECISNDASQIVMITPSRWMTCNRGYKDVRKLYVSYDHMKTIVHFPKSATVFKGSDISGGVSYFHWDRAYTGTCSLNGTSRTLGTGEPIVLDNSAITIVDKIKSSFNVFCDSVCHGANTYVVETNHSQLSSAPGAVSCMFVGENYKDIDQSSFTDRDLTINRWKVVCLYAEGGAQKIRSNGKKTVISSVHIIDPGKICSSTYVVIGSFHSLSDAIVYKRYIESRTARFLIGLYRSKLLVRSCFRALPVLPWDEIPETDMTDEFLSALFGLDASEVDYINGTIND